jgi:putative ABC transport system permease protein
MNSLLQDIRFAVRLLLRKPAFAIFSVLILGVGIGANTAIYTVVEALLLRPLPLPDPSQLVTLCEAAEGVRLSQTRTSPLNYRDWCERNRTFESIGIYRITNFAFQGLDRSERVFGARASANFFSTLGLPPRLGRWFSDREEIENAPVALISETLWRALFAAQTDVLGTQINLDGRGYTVVGVMPAAFQFPDKATQVWIPLALTAEEATSRDWYAFQTVGRLKSGVSLEQARLDMDRIAQELAAAYPTMQKGHMIKLIPFAAFRSGDIRQSLTLLLGAVSCLLLIVCINLAVLSLARAAARQKEMATRAALGASSWRLIQQLLAEALGIAILGGLVGVFCADVGLKLFLAIAADYLPQRLPDGLSAQALVFLLICSLCAMLCCGLAPLRYAIGRSGIELSNALRATRGTVGGGRGHARLREILVVSEVAGAFLLLTCASLLLESFVRLQRAESGFSQPRQVLTARVALPPPHYPDGNSVTGFYRKVQEQLQTIPQVQSAGAVNILALTARHNSTLFEIEGAPPVPPENRPLAEQRAVGRQYFEAAGIPLLAGRLFDGRDDPGTVSTVLINRALATRFWKLPEDALGHRMLLNGSAVTIVGVVGDTRQVRLAELPDLEVYYPATRVQSTELGIGLPAHDMTFLLRAKAEWSAEQLTEPLRQVIRQVDPRLPLFSVRTLDAVIQDSVATERTTTWLITGFATSALVLASLGIYGVISYGVTQRTREIGVRLALGQQRASVLWLVVGKGMKLAITGIATGLLLLFFSIRLVSGLLYGVGAINPATIALATAVILAAALSANYLPGLRATRIDPLTALREE